MDKLYSRRDFFRKSANRVLPVLLLASIPAIDVVAKAAPQDCEGSCKGDCRGTCRGTCRGLCAVGCGGACSGTCKYTCNKYCEATAKAPIESDSIKVDSLKIK